MVHNYNVFKPRGAGQKVHRRHHGAQRPCDERRGVPRSTDIELTWEGRTLKIRITDLRPQGPKKLEDDDVMISEDTG